MCKIIYDSPLISRMVGLVAMQYFPFTQFDSAYVRFASLFWDSQRISHSFNVNFFMEIKTKLN